MQNFSFFDPEDVVTYVERAKTEKANLFAVMPRYIVRGDLVQNFSFFDPEDVVTYVEWAKTEKANLFAVMPKYTALFSFGD